MKIWYFDRVNLINVNSIQELHVQIRKYQKNNTIRHCERSEAISYK